jgi:uncharacterized protein with NRDE domain
VIVAVRRVPRFPLVLGANRDEAPSRAGAPPRLIAGSPRVWAGLDPKAGGTWLGLNERGLVVALTNRLTPEFNPDLRSRGLLCLDALRQPDARSATEFARRECAARKYNYFNLLCADRTEAFAVYGDGGVEVELVRPGLHVLSHGRLDETGSVKVAHARCLVVRVPKLRSVTDWIARLKEVCADEEEGRDPADRICVRAKNVATLSSTILAVHESGLADSMYLHCQGVPGEAPYRDLSNLLR